MGMKRWRHSLRFLMLALMLGLLIAPTVRNVGAQEATPVPAESEATEVAPAAPASCVAVNDDYFTYQNQKKTVFAPGVFGNDTLVGTYALQDVSATTKGGTATVGADGMMTYTPPTATFTGFDTFTYTVRCGVGDVFSDVTATVTIETRDGSGPDVPCTATNDTYTTKMDTQLNVPAPGLLTNDTGRNMQSDATSTLPQHGKIMQGSDGQLVYTPDAGYVGVDGYIYHLRCNDDAGNMTGESLATVEITVSDLTSVTCNPQDDYYTILKNTNLTLFAPGVFANDIFSDAYALQNVEPAQHAMTNTIGSAGELEYVPNTDYVGQDTFKYSVQCPRAVGLPIFAFATVHINVVDTLPTITCAANDDYYTVVKNTPLTVPAPGVFGNDTYSDAFALRSETAAAHGKNITGADGNLSYTPDQGYTGQDSFQYLVQCPQAVGLPIFTTATVHLTIVDEFPTVTCLAVNDYYTMLMNTTLTAPAPGVFGNDVYSDAFSLRSVTNAMHGTNTIGADGKLVYTPDPNYTGKDTFQYLVQCPQKVGLPIFTTATVTIDVEPQLTNCAVKDDYYITPMNTKVTDAAPGVWANDTLVGTYALQDVHPAAHGMGVVGSMGEMEYTPDPGFVGIDTYEYVVRCDDDDQDDTTAAFAPTYLTATIHIQVGDVATPTTTPTTTVTPSTTVTPVATTTPTGKPTVPTVSKLPVTGAGATDDHGTNTIVLALASLLVLAGGATATMGVRRRRS